MENDILEMESLSDAEELEGDARLEMIEEDVGEKKTTLSLLFKLLLYLLFGILIGQSFTQMVEEVNCMPRESFLHQSVLKSVCKLGD